jgi:hypothetical protein
MGGTALENMRTQPTDLGPVAKANTERMRTYIRSVRVGDGSKPEENYAIGNVG